MLLARASLLNGFGVLGVRVFVLAAGSRARSGVATEPVRSAAGVIWLAAVVRSEPTDRARLRAAVRLGVPECINDQFELKRTN